MASAKNHRATEDAPATSGEDSALRPLKHPRQRTFEVAPAEANPENPTFYVKLSQGEAKEDRWGSVGMLLALAVLLAAVCYLIFVLNRNSSAAPLLAANPEAVEAQGANPVPVVEGGPVISSSSPRYLDEVAETESSPSSSEPSSSAPALLGEPLDLEQQLDPIESLLAYGQFGDSIRYVLDLERRFSGTSGALTVQIRSILQEWLDSGESPTVHDQEIIALLAERGFEKAIVGLVFRGAEKMPDDAVWTRAAAERGHVASMLRLAKLNGDAAAETWYRKAAKAGSQEAIDWCDKNGLAY